MKALIAEYNAVNRELLRELLERKGCEVVEARDGQDTVEMIARERPKILLLDISMPRLDGFGVIHKIRENPETADLPVLAVTAYAMSGDRERILSAGFDGYLSKPISETLLGREIARVLGHDSDCSGGTGETTHRAGSLN
jgi:CheY-like chemotaxis protein